MIALCVITAVSAVVVQTAKYLYVPCEQTEPSSKVKENTIHKKKSSDDQYIGNSFYRRKHINSREERKLKGIFALLWSIGSEFLFIFNIHSKKREKKILRPRCRRLKS